MERRSDAARALEVVITEPFRATQGSAFRTRRNATAGEKQIPRRAYALLVMTVT